MMSPPATSVHEAPGSKTGVSIRCGRRAVRLHAAVVLTAPTPNRNRPPQPSARTDGPTASARRTPRRFRFLARSLISEAASGVRTKPSSPAGRSTPSPARIASASFSTSSSDCHRGLVPASAARTSSPPIPSTVVRNWPTGTIGTSASMVATGGSLAGPGASGDGLHVGCCDTVGEPADALDGCDGATATPEEASGRPRLAFQTTPDASATARTATAATTGRRFTAEGCHAVEGRTDDDPDREPGRKTPRPGGRTGREGCARWRTRPDSNRRSPA